MTRVGDAAAGPTRARITALGTAGPRIPALGTPDERIAALGTPATRIAALALLVLVAACASPGSSGSLPAGSGIVVSYFDAGDDVLLELANESHPDFQDRYSTSISAQHATLKLAPDELIADLLDDLDRLGFARLARPGPPPRSGVRAWLQVRRDGRNDTLVFPLGALNQELGTAYVGIKLTMDDYYRHVGGLQYIENPAGHDLFQEGR